MEFSPQLGSTDTNSVIRKVKVVGGLLGPLSYVNWLSSRGPCLLDVFNKK